MKVSVVMSVYNEKISWLRESVDSIMNQTYSDFEFIVVIDNPNLSSDCVDFLESVASKDKRVVLIYNKENMGLARSLNKGIDISRGQFIMRMDADDVSFPTRFREQMDYLDSHTCDMVATNICFIDENSDLIGYSEDRPENPERHLLYSNIIPHPTVLIKKSAITNVGGYRNFKRSQDYDLWLRLLSSGYKIRIINKPLLKYRLRTTSISSRGPLEQYYTNLYQKSLFKERAKKGHDSFSLENFEAFLTKKKITVGKEKRFEKAMDNLNKAKRSIASKKIAFVYFYIKCFFAFPSVAVNGFFNYCKKRAL